MIITQKNLLIFLIFVGFSFPFTYAKKLEENYPIGEITREDLHKYPFQIYFDYNYGAYNLDAELLKAVEGIWSDISIIIFMGSWCHDSQREIPALFKILDSIAFDASKIRMIALSKDKSTPDKIEKKFSVTRTPTIIFYRSGKEIGRYVEHARTSLEKDILAILSGDDYEESYYQDPVTPSPR